MRANVLAEAARATSRLSCDDPADVTPKAGTLDVIPNKQRESKVAAVRNGMSYPLSATFTSDRKTGVTYVTYTAVRWLSST